MDREFIVVGKGDDVISEFLQGIVYFSRPVVALVKQSINLGVGVEISPFPTIGAIQCGIWIKNIRPAEWFRGLEAIYRTYACDCYGGNDQEQ